MQQLEGLKALYLELEQFRMSTDASPAITFAPVEEMPEHFQGRTLVFVCIKGRGRSDGKEFFGILISEQKDNEQIDLYRVYQEEDQEVSHEVTVDSINDIPQPPKEDLDLMLSALLNFLNEFENLDTAVTPTNHDIRVLH